MHVKPPRDQPRFCAQAPLFFRSPPRQGRELWCCRSCAARRPSDPTKPASSGRRLAQNLVRLPQFTNIALQRLHLVGLGRDTGALAAVDLSLLHPLMQRPRNAADLLRDRNHRRPSERGDHFRDRSPYAPRARGPPAQACSLSCSYRLHLLRSWSLRQTRRGSFGGMSSRQRKLTMVRPFQILCNALGSQQAAESRFSTGCDR